MPLSVERVTVHTRSPGALNTPVRASAACGDAGAVNTIVASIAHAASTAFIRVLLLSCEFESSVVETQHAIGGRGGVRSMRHQDHGRAALPGERVELGEDHTSVIVV